ncbi:hypothetical protein DFO66_10979 [Brevibacterium sanguinis]|uniref:Uncharacterized protein n=2 Tax=Brevibacterium TaxID=1696 RepID=A0A366IJ45_9MICO|nr:MULTISPECIES: hypothetical protein [Brevibacterium]RBP63649.1 hypothetical protein DFO66_10979 [Brevibacterium sanguinis]RBP70308.1 hypothetical protein DFO65_10979 [Brevibacterium celere]
MSNEKKLRDAAQGLDESLEPVAGTSDMESGADAGYQEDDSEERLQQVADEQGVTLIENADGSHTAIDESKADDADLAAGDTRSDETPPSEPPD